MDEENITNKAFESGSVLNEILTGSETPGVLYLQKLIPSLVSIFLLLGSLFFFFFILWGAVEWISSGGDKGKIEAARTRITNSVIGLAILYSTWAIVNVISTFFGITIFNLNLGNLVIR